VSIKVSVIIPSYNYGKFIGRAIRSAINQTYPKSNYEIIVIDDCSTDKSRDIIEAFGSVIRPVFLDKNIGIAAVRNQGIFMARGEYITFLDADDCWNKHYLQHSMLYFEFKPYLKTVIHDATIIADDDSHVTTIPWDEYHLVGGAVYKAEALVLCGLFDETLAKDEDKDFLYRYFAYSEPYEHEFISLPLYRYRYHENNKSKGREIWQREDIQSSIKSCTPSLK